MPWMAIMAIASAIGAAGTLMGEPEPEEDEVGMRGFKGDEYTRHELGSAGGRYRAPVPPQRRSAGLMRAVSGTRRY